MKVLFLFALLVSATDGPKVADNPWAGRSGQAEALADVAAGRPVKLLYHGISGERAELHTPGLLDCHPERYDVPNDARGQFEYIGDADYSESLRYTDDQARRRRSAALFARAYNVTLFTVRRDEVLKICPAALQDDR